MKKLLITLSISLLVFSEISSQELFFNEIDYTTSNERGVGVYGTANKDLTDYSVYIYTNSGTLLEVYNIMDVIPSDDLYPSHGELWIDVPVLNITNGNQGVMLVSPEGLPIHFINFGGSNETITVYINEESYTSIYVGAHNSGKSLQVTGTGCTFQDFYTAGSLYNSSQTKSANSINQNQVVDCLNFSGVLPIDLLFFKGQLEQYGVELKWRTATELNNELVEIQHSLDGQNYRTIHEEYSSGNKLTITDYKFIDRHYQLGNNYYRLKQTDRDGTVRYEGGIILVEVNKDLEVWNIQPNPANDYLEINLSGSNLIDSTIDIYNLLGQKIYTFTLAEGQIYTKIDITELPKGRYLLRSALGTKPFQKL